MAAQLENAFGSFQASVALTANRAVELLATGKVRHVVTEGVKGIGVAQEDVATDGYGTVRLWGAPGTVRVAVTGTAVTVANLYDITTGGYAAAVTTPSMLRALDNGVASNGIVLEFQEVI